MPKSRTLDRKPLALDRLSGRGAPRPRELSQQGAKVLVALSGALMSGWAFLHMAGTLGVFAGPESMNGYARLLRQVPGALVVMRGFLLILFGVHVTLTVRLVQRARRARPVRYARSRGMRRTWVSRTMKVTGPLLGLWLLWHVLDMYGFLPGTHVPGDVYFNLVLGLGDGWVNASYVLAAVFFGLHLWHGLLSVLGTVGTPRRIQLMLRPLALAFVLVVTLGFLAPSFGVISGLISTHP